MIDQIPRLRREWETIEVMIKIYCRDHHAGSAGLCPECSELAGYARHRLAKCPFQVDKPPCAKCPIHCYQKVRRDQIKAVMRYSGPRMMFRHPIFALKHWLDAHKKVPPKPKRGDRKPVASWALPPGESKDSKSDPTQT